MFRLALSSTSRLTRRTFTAARTAHFQPIRPIQPTRPYTSHQTKADESIEALQELYATAKDEFEIAHEETSKKSIYASADREAAREEFDRLRTAYDEAVGRSEEGSAGAEIKSRIGQRIRELENALKNLEQEATEGG